MVDESVSSHPAKIRFTIENLKGQLIFVQRELTVHAVEGSLQSMAFLLPEDNFILTEFVVMNGANEVIYAAPIADSPMAELVEVPLGISFSTSNHVNKIYPEILPLGICVSAIDFGYEHFERNEKQFMQVPVTTYFSGVQESPNSDFKIEVIGFNEKNEMIWKCEHESSSKTHVLDLKSNAEFYKITASKEGYRDHFQFYSYDEIDTISDLSFGLIASELVSSIELIDGFSILYSIDLCKNWMRLINENNYTLDYVYMHLIYNTLENGNYSHVAGYQSYELVNQRDLNTRSQGLNVLGEVPYSITADICTKFDSLEDDQDRTILTEMFIYFEYSDQLYYLDLYLPEFKYPQLR